MIVTVVKSSFVKRRPRIIIYRDYSKFDPSKSKEDLQKELMKKALAVRNLKFSTL